MAIDENIARLRSHISTRKENDDATAARATPYPIPRYLSALARVCDDLIAPGGVTSARVFADRVGGLGIEVTLADTAPRPFVVYSGHPDLQTDVLALFTNLHEWVVEKSPPFALTLGCPLDGHSDTWGVRVSPSQVPTETRPTLWRVCNGTLQTIDEYTV